MFFWISGIFDVFDVFLDVTPGKRWFIGCAAKFCAEIRSRNWIWWDESRKMVLDVFLLIFGHVGDHFSSPQGAIRILVMWGRARALDHGPCRAGTQALQGPGPTGNGTPPVSPP